MHVGCNVALLVVVGSAEWTYRRSVASTQAETQKKPLQFCVFRWEFKFNDERWVTFVIYFIIFLACLVKRFGEELESECDIDENLIRDLQYYFKKKKKWNSSMQWCDCCLYCGFSGRIVQYRKLAKYVENFDLFWTSAILKILIIISIEKQKKKKIEIGWNIKKIKRKFKILFLVLI